MSPSHDCLGVWELLGNVLLNLPATDLTRVMRVSRTWKQLIERSTRLRDNLVVATLPASALPLKDFRLYRHGIPEYDSDAGLRNNPVIEAGHFPPNRFDSILTELRNCTSANERLKWRKHEFATFPPCQKMLLEIGLPPHTCTVHVKNGIRIGDLLSATDAVLAAEATYGEGSLEEYAAAWLVGCALSRTSKRAGRR